MSLKLIGYGALLLAAACAHLPGVKRPETPPERTAIAAPAPGTTAAPPPRSARTVEQFDTTSAAERRAAAAPPPAAAERQLGRTVASLGNPADPGFWAETGLVTEIRQGRLEYPGGGTSVKVELRPSGGEVGAGTRVSLPALRVLEAPLTDLPELVVYAE
ncbi:D-galactarate dehydratase [Tropicimonas sp.]|uniref:D-galactarate dehydratase n=1 Tax=Tropicimonas sp. TaxID=2067044 RepID=UPI003A83E769